MPERAMPEANHPPATPRIHGERRRKVVSTVKLEFERLLVRILFLWIMFGLFELYHTIILDKEHVDYSVHGFALVNAIVMSKVLLIAEDLKFASRLHDGRLIYFHPLQIGALFALLFLGGPHGRGCDQGPDRRSRPDGPACRTRAVSMWCFARRRSFSPRSVPYFAFREIERVMGECRSCMT